jgi:hypothetical protein
MAEAEKAGRRAAMYDNERSKARRDGDKPARREEPARSDDSEKLGAGGESMQNRHSKAREGLFKTQEGERRDLHGNHREEHRQMNSRHEKQVADMHKAQLAEMLATAGGTGGAPMAEPPQGAAPQQPPEDA